MEPQFELKPRTWYGMELLFSDGKWHYSPVWIEDVMPRKTGNGILLVRFFHAAYAKGVQSKEYNLQVIRRSEGYLLALRVEYENTSGHPIIFQGMSIGWLEKHFPGQFNASADLSAQLDRVSGRLPALTD